MRLFLDTSVILAACGSTQGASHQIFRLATTKNWILIATPYVIQEIEQNLDKLPDEAIGTWTRLRRLVKIADDVVTLDRPAIFRARKDRQVLFSALAWADVLLTLDKNDFGDLLGGTFYDLPILKPGSFLEKERDTGRL